MEDAKLASVYVLLQLSGGVTNPRMIFPENGRISDGPMMCPVLG